MANPELDNYVVPPLEKENTDLRDRIAALEMEYDSRIAAMDRSRAKADEQWTAKVASLAEALELSVAQHREATAERDALRAEATKLKWKVDAADEALEQAETDIMHLAGPDSLIKASVTAIREARKDLTAEVEFCDSERGIISAARAEAGRMRAALEKLCELDSNGDCRLCRKKVPPLHPDDVRRRIAYGHDVGDVCKCAARAALAPAPPKEEPKPFTSSLPFPFSQLFCPKCHSVGKLVTGGGVACGKCAAVWAPLRREEPKPEPAKRGDYVSGPTLEMGLGEDPAVEVKAIRQEVTRLTREHEIRRDDWAQIRDDDALLQVDAMKPALRLAEEALLGAGFVLDEATKAADWHNTTGMKVARTPPFPPSVAKMLKDALWKVPEALAALAALKIGGGK